VKRGVQRPERREGAFVVRAEDELVGVEEVRDGGAFPLELGVRRDEEVLAQVSKILVETGIKTPKQVEARYWDWDEGTRASTSAPTDREDDEGAGVGSAGTTNGAGRTDTPEEGT